MFEKFNKHVFHRTMQNVKSHIGNGYNAIKNIAHNIDHGVHIAKKIYVDSRYCTADSNSDSDLFYTAIKKYILTRKMRYAY